MLKLAVLLCVMLLSAAAAVSDPYQKGKYINNLSDINVGTHLAPVEGANVHLFIVAPNSTTVESFPVFLFWTSFAGKVPSTFFRNFLHHVSSHGVVAVGFDAQTKMSSLDFQKDVAVMLESTMAWLKDGNLQNLISQNGVSAIANFDKLILSGHSAGGHSVTQILTDGCFDIDGVVLIDPVDGFAPWAISDKVTQKTSVIHPPVKVNFMVPLLHIENLFDPVSPFPGKAIFPPCAPEDMSNDRFFNAWRGPAWQINATQFGHMDIVNSGDIGALSKAFDIVCAGNPDNESYISLVAGSTVSFLNMLVGEDATASATYQMYLEDKSVMPTDVILRQVYNGYKAPYAGFCTRFRG